MSLFPSPQFHEVGFYGDTCHTFQIGTKEEAVCWICGNTKIGHQRCGLMSLTSAPAVKHGGGEIMVWGIRKKSWALLYGLRPYLYYGEVMIPTTHRMGEDFIFQQAVSSSMVSQGITVMEWPPQKSCPEPWVLVGYLERKSESYNTTKKT